MKKFLKIVGIIFSIILIAIIGLLSYVKIALPKVEPATALKVEITPERIARGEYLAKYVSMCVDCHSTRDFSQFAGPIVAGTEGKGGEVFDQNFGLPGKYVAKNITPAGLGSWTDGEIFRTLTTGVNKDGKALFPIMPYEHFAQADPEDIYSVIAYIRTLAPIEYTPDESESDFPMNFIINTIPHDANEMGKRPDKSNLVEYGQYMVNLASCSECHTPREKGAPIPGMDFAGGAEFNLGDYGIARPANITPDIETGIGSWDEQAFLHKFKSFADSSYSPPRVSPGEVQTIMPWLMYSKMDSTDLKAIYAYLKTLKPVKNVVTKFTAKS